MAKAVCVRCGLAKRRVLSTCRNCGFSPQIDSVALAKSIILSIERFEDGGDRQRYATELDGIGERLRAGGAVEYDPKEVDDLINDTAQAKRLPWWMGLKVFAMVMLSLWPGWLLLALAVWLWLHR